MFPFTNLLAQDDGPVPLWIVPIGLVLVVLGTVGLVFLPVLIVKGGATLMRLIRRRR